MAELRIDTATSSDMSNAVADVEIPSYTTDGATGDKETTYQNPDVSKWLGFYRNIPELKQAIDTRALWTVGKGWTADSLTTVRLESMQGLGVDTFDTIIMNMIVMRRVAGDSFAEIIRDVKTNDIINIKPLDPSVVTIVANKQGIIIRYEQTEKTSKKVIHKFKPNDILHLTNKRVADEIHGVSDIEAIQNIISASNESFADMKQLQHRHVRPIMAFKLDTDDQTEINTFITKMDAVVNKGENIYIPKDTVEFELISVPSNATLNPLPWRNHLRDYFFQVAGIPQIILGSSGEFTESTAKIAYLAFSQSVLSEQKDIEDQLWNQIQVKIVFTKPASLQNELISDTAKDGEAQQQGVGVQANDTTAGVGE